MTPTRERRVWKVMKKFFSATLLIVTLALGVGLLNIRSPSDILNGFELGLLAALPVGMSIILYRAYRQMDEYTQRVQERAAAFAFLMSMMAAMVGSVFTQAAHLTLPLWALYVFGMAIYGAGVLLQRQRDG